MAEDERVAALDELEDLNTHVGKDGACQARRLLADAELHGHKYANSASRPLFRDLGLGALPLVRRTGCALPLSARGPK
ncbi:hypothetical protein [Streptomyces hayashii]|uniref:hypothetical protein n=1 Tax=Streptomyces hayashii TaxID=2839966 RepID=UPI00403C860E